VLDDDEGVAQILQPDEGLDQPAVVALVQPDGGLVEHVQHARQPGADLRREPDALGLPAGERARGASEAQIVESDLHEEVQARADLPEDGGGDLGFAVGQLELREVLLRVGQTHARRIGDRMVVHQDGQHLGLQTVAVAHGTRDLTKVLRPSLALRVGLGLGVLTLDVGHHPSNPDE
jgi:hypothetical protein